VAPSDWTLRGVTRLVLRLAGQGCFPWPLEAWRSGAMMTRRIFEGVVIISLLMWPARSTVHLWGQKQLSAHQPGEFMHGLGEVIVSIT
jgi:hypothetical protein